jgi:hypothetical protein
MWCIRCSSFSRSFRSLLRGLNPEGMIAVGMIGFEPTTPSSRTRCATKLRYIPSIWSYKYTIQGFWPGMGYSKATTKSIADAEQIRVIAYSMDTLVPGFYVWLGSLTLRIGGCIPDDQPCRYPGTLHSRFGLAIVLPGHHIFTLYN